jgi:acyl-CoA thioesterase-1
MDAHPHSPAFIGIGMAAALAAAVVLATGQASAASASVVASSESSPSSDVAIPALTVLTIGDSIMNGHGLPEGEAWPFLLAANEGWTLANAACDGVGVIASGDPGECNSTYTGVIAAAANLHPDIVIFEGSSNDFGQDNAALLTATESDLKMLRAEFPSAEIIGLSTLWGYTDPPAQLAQVNAQVQQAVTEVGGAYVDIGQPMSGHPEWMQADDVHPDAAGQAVLASTIQTAIQTEVDKVLKEQREAIDKVDALIQSGRLQ